MKNILMYKLLLTVNTLHFYNLLYFLGGTDHDDAEIGPK